MVENKADWFDRFWAAYPNKKSKGTARKAWDKIKPDEDLAWQIVFAVDAQKKWRGREKKAGTFIPGWQYPATWLNAMAWLDELPSSQDIRARAQKGRRCDDCQEDASVYVGEKGYCARHYCQRFTDYREQLYEAAKRAHMLKRKDETLSDYYSRCREWSLTNKQKAKIKPFSGPT